MYIFFGGGGGVFTLSAMDSKIVLGSSMKKYKVEDILTELELANSVVMNTHRVTRVTGPDCAVMCN